MRRDTKSDLSRRKSMYLKRELCIFIISQALNLPMSSQYKIERKDTDKINDMKQTTES